MAEGSESDLTSLWDLEKRIYAAQMNLSLSDTCETDSEDYMAESDDNEEEEEEEDDDDDDDDSSKLDKPVELEIEVDSEEFKANVQQRLQRERFREQMFSALIGSDEGIMREEATVAYEIRRRECAERYKAMKKVQKEGLLGN